MSKDSNTLINTAEFAEFINHGAAEVTPATVHRLVALLPDLREKFATVQAPGFPKASAQFAFLGDVVEACAADAYRDLPYLATSEAAFALLYLVREVDVIPDSVERIGFLDDALVAALVLQRHAAEFGKFARHTGADWAAVEPTG